jgi:hypothetical protein
MTPTKFLHSEKVLITSNKTHYASAFHTEAKIVLMHNPLISCHVFHVLLNLHLHACVSGSGAALPPHCTVVHHKTFYVY